MNMPEDYRPIDNDPDLERMVAHAREASDRTERVRRTIERLTKPMFVYRMARAQVNAKGPRGRGAQTTFFKVVKEIDDILKEEYGGKA